MLASEQPAAANPHQSGHRIVAITRVADDIAVATLHRHDDGRLLHLLEMIERVTQLGGPLEVERLGCLAHSLTDPPTTSCVRPSRNTSTSSIIARYCASVCA